MNRRNFLISSTLGGLMSGNAARPVEIAENKPNIVFIMADDLGYAELGCYGQEKIKTPNLDRLCSQGMKFTDHYSGAPVCAPARCSLMTGKHLGHAHIRSNREVKPLGQEPIPDSETTVAELLKNEGYATGAFGKWGLGPPGSPGDPLNQGFDRFYGYNCQRNAHSLFPEYIQDNDNRLKLKNDPPVPGHAKLPTDADPDDPESYERYRGKDFAPDRIHAQTLKFIRKNADRPFFLYYPTVIPHLALQVVDDEILQKYESLDWEDPPNRARYTPCYHPRATYAALITRLDHYVGKILDELEKQGVADNTVVVFTSDNGATYLGPMAKFFNSVGPLRGLKGSMYEGGIRVPMIIKWPGHIKPGSVSKRRTGFEDWLPTLAEIAGAKDRIPKEVDGISIVPTLEGRLQQERPFLYREFPSYGGQQAAWIKKWKGIRRNMQKGNTKIELYDLEEDISESNNVAGEHPEIAARIKTIMQQQHTPSKLFRIRAIDEK